MFLKEIKLTNFKCHSNLELNFETGESKKPIRHMTFLLGENGTGKSALLKAIGLVTAGSTALGELLGTADDWIKNGASFCGIEATLTTAEGEERKIKLHIDRGAHLSEIIGKNLESLQLIDDAISHASRNYFVVGYGASRRLNRDLQLAGASELSNARAKRVKSLFNPDAALVSLSNWAMDLDYTGKGEGLAAVKRALSEFLVDDVNFKEIDREKKQLIFTTPDGDVPLTHLSDGYQNVAAWVGDLMFRVNQTFDDFKKPLNARGLLLIDEIDLHLHPKWQRRLHIFLTTKLPNFQIIATTHSPLTAQQAAENELYALQRDGAQIDLVPFRGAPNKMLLHQILMSPVFGLESDESLVVEEAKAKRREISLQGKKPTAAAKRSFAVQENILSETTMNIRSNALFSQEDFELLRAINKELKAKK